MKAAFCLDAVKGKQKLKQLAKWLEQEYPSGRSSLLEGLDEMFTINALGLPKSLRRCWIWKNDSSGSWVINIFGYWMPNLKS